MNFYVVDTNFFTQAHRMDYPLGEALPFWQHVKQLAEAGTIVSLDRVWVDIQTHDTALETWCQDNLPQNFFRSSIQLLQHYEKIVEWTITQRENYLPNALKEFLSAREAGAWLVAYSIENGCTIVTYESNRPEQRHQIKLPEVCDAFGVPHLNTATMFAQLGIAL